MLISKVIDLIGNLRAGQQIVEDTLTNCGVDSAAYNARTDGDDTTVTESDRQ